MDVKKYNKIKIWLNIFSSSIFIIVLLLIIVSGLNKAIEQWISDFVQSDYLKFIFFVMIISIIISIITFPIDFYSSYILEHKYNLSNQTIKSYFIDKIKSLLVFIIIGLPILIIFYYLLKNYPENWWLFFSIAMFFISVILAQIFPIFIFPIFFKLKPIEDEQLINEIKVLADKSNFKFSKIYSFDLSTKTKKANAALTGFGKTKKIILGDTLLNSLSTEEIKTVLAHEIGHYKLKHIPQNLIISTFQSFLIFYIISILYKISIEYFSYKSVADISAFPIIILIGFLVGIIMTPLSNMISRKFEYDADLFAVKFTALSDVFKSALTKLYEKNLSDKQPHPFVEWYFYSHPSYYNRIKNIDKYLNARK